jgi:hypothetical protein
MVCSIDFDDISEERIPTKQLFYSILQYMNSERFNPEVELTISQILKITG